MALFRASSASERLLAVERQPTPRWRSGLRIGVRSEDLVQPILEILVEIVQIVVIVEIVSELI